MSVVRLRSAEFRREREATWRELERLLSAVERGGVRSLSASEVVRLPVVHRATLSSLSVARAISLDRNLLDYLEALAARSYVAVYASRRGLLASVLDFVGRRFPETFRARWRAIALSAALLVGGAAVGMATTSRDLESFYAFVPAEMAGGRDPSASTEFLRGSLYGRAGEGDALAVFASFLFGHNAWIGWLAFGLGIAAGLPTALLLFGNGLVLGAFTALYQGRGLGVDVWGWLLPHGIPELTAVVLCGAAGFLVAHAALFPGRRTRLENLARAGREAGVLVVGATLLLLFAALVEGFFRQTVTDVGTRYAMAAISAGTLVVWLGFVGRRGR